MKQYELDISYSASGTLVINADSEEEAIEKFKEMCFDEVIERSSAFVDADEMDIDDIYEVKE
jgi:hypothetical protein